MWFWCLSFSRERERKERKRESVYNVDKKETSLQKTNETIFISRLNQNIKKKPVIELKMKIFFLNKN